MNITIEKFDKITINKLCSKISTSYRQLRKIENKKVFHDNFNNLRTFQVNSKNIDIKA